MSGLAGRLPVTHTDPLQYAFDLLFTAYAPEGLDRTAARHPEEWLRSSDGIAAIQRAVADDPKANVPDDVRVSLRQHAAA